MTFVCKTCSKEYKTYKGMWKHSKNKHEQHDNSKDVICNFCNKSYSSKNSLCNHKKICKSNPINLIPVVNRPDITLDLVKKLIPEIINSLNISQENISKMQPKNFNNVKKINNVGNIDGNNNQIGDHQTNNNFNIISLGNENLSDVISKNDQIKILKQKNDALLEIIKLVHFSSKYPQFHNIAIQGEKAYQYNDTENKFLETPKKEMLFDLVENRVNDIFEFNEENKLSLSRKTYSWIKCYTNMFEFETRIKNSIEKIEPVIVHETDKLITLKQIKLEEPGEIIQDFGQF